LREASAQSRNDPMAGQAWSGRTGTSFFSEGERVPALLYRPEACFARAPAIIVSPSRVTPIEEMSWLAEPLVAAGYTVLVHAYRPGLRYQIRDVADVRNAVSWVIESADGDPDRIAVIGHSRGASAALRAAGEDSRIRSAIALSCPTNIARYMDGLRNHSPSRFATLVNGYGGIPEDDLTYYRQISPLFHAARISAPVLLIHGIDDMVAPKENSEWMQGALRESGNSNVRLALIAEAGHFFEHRFDGYLFDPVLKVIGQWLEETLAARPSVERRQ